MSLNPKQKTVRNIFVKYTDFSKREADRIVLEATPENIEALVTASPEDAEAAAKKVFNDIRIAEGQSIQNQQIKEPAPMLDGEGPAWVADEIASEVVASEEVTETTSPAAGLDADE